MILRTRKVRIANLEVWKLKVPCNKSGKHFLNLNDTGQQLMRALCVAVRAPSSKPFQFLKNAVDDDIPSVPVFHSYLTTGE